VHFVGLFLSSSPLILWRWQCSADAAPVTYIHVKYATVFRKEYHF